MGHSTCYQWCQLWSSIRIHYNWQFLKNFSSEAVSRFCKVFISLGACLLLVQPADIKGDTWLSKCLSIAMSVPDILSDTRNSNIFLAHVWQTVQTFIVHVSHPDPWHLGITVPIGLVLGVCYLTCFSYWFSVGPGSPVEFSMQCMVRILISYYWS